MTAAIRASVGQFRWRWFAWVASLACQTALAAAFATDAETGAALTRTWMVARRQACEGVLRCNYACVEIRAGVDENVLPFWRSATDYAWLFYRNGYYEADNTPSRPRLSSKRPADLAPGWDDASARISYLKSLASRASCIEVSASERQGQFAFFRELIDEGLSLATLPEQKEDVQQRACRLLVEVEGGTAPPGCQERLDFRERDAFLDAARQGDVATLQDMLPQEMTAAFRSRRLAPALAMAALAGQVKAMRLLLGLHADPGPAFERVLQQRLGGASPSAEFGLHTPTLRRARKSMQDILPAASTPQQATAAEQAGVAAEVLLAAGADTKGGDGQGHTPLHRMAIAGDAQMIALLLRYGAEVNQPARACESCTGHGETPLADAANASIAEQLIAAGANVNAKNRDGWPTLVLTANADVATVLVDRGADVNARFATGWTPLGKWLSLYEAYRTNPAMAQPLADVARRLVLAGAELSSKDERGVNVLDNTKDQALKAELSAIAAQRQSPAQ